jgi:hypothetical protein
VDDYKPFRWDVSKREQLPKVAPPEIGPHWPQFELELRLCAARVIAAAGDTDWVFVGRSPEHLFDYLSGIFEGVPEPPSLTHLRFSLRWGDGETIARKHPQAFAALASYFEVERLDPGAIAAFGKAVAFIDVVSSGGTFCNLVSCLQLWCREKRVDWNAVQRRVRFVGITVREKASPKTWRWQQHQDWLAELPDAKVKNVSVPYWVFQDMAGNLDKLTPSHTQDRWDLIRGGGPPRNPKHARALGIACRLYDLGRSTKERRSLAGEIARRRGDMRSAWLRGVVLKLRQKSQRA